MSRFGHGDVGLNKEKGAIMRKFRVVKRGVLGGLVLGLTAVFSTATSPMPDNSGKQARLSLSKGGSFSKINLVVNAEPLGSVIEKLSIATGTEIALSEDWMAALPVTAVVKCNNLDQAFKQLCGRLSYALSYEENDGKIVRIVATVKIPEASASDIRLVSDSSMLAKMMEEASERVVSPPDPNRFEVIPGLTLAALREIEARSIDKFVDESKMEAVPGLKITKLREMEKRCENMSVDESKSTVVPGLSVEAFKAYYGQASSNASEM